MTLRLVLCILLLGTIASATQGTWVLYYTDTETINADNSVTVTPTVGISGDDDGYCNIESGFYGWETPLVMLTGNAWAMGDTQGAGGENYGGYPLAFSYTFPDATIPSNGTQEVDLSYAGKVQGTCYLTYGEGAVPPFNLASFFVTAFIEGSGSISPSPCFLGGSPVCSLPFPYSFQTVPAHGHPFDLYSGQVAQRVPSILQDKKLWFFGVGNSPPSNFMLGSTSATLTANGVSSGTFTWTITKGTLEAVLENGSSTITKTNINQVGVSSTFYSTQANDVTVKLLYTPPGASGAFTVLYSFGIDSPYELVAGTPTDRGVSTRAERLGRVSKHCALYN